MAERELRRGGQVDITVNTKDSMCSNVHGIVGDISDLPFHEALRHLIVAHNFTSIRAVAESCQQVNEERMRELLIDKQAPTVLEMQALAQTLGVRTEYFLLYRKFKAAKEAAEFSANPITDEEIVRIAHVDANSR